MSHPAQRGPAPSKRPGPAAPPPPTLAYGLNPADFEERPGAFCERWPADKLVVSTKIDPAAWPDWTDAGFWAPSAPVVKGGRDDV